MRTSTPLAAGSSNRYKGLAGLSTMGTSLGREGTRGGTLALFLLRSQAANKDGRKGEERMLGEEEGSNCDSRPRRQEYAATQVRTFEGQAQDMPHVLLLDL